MVKALFPVFTMYTIAMKGKPFNFSHLWSTHPGLVMNLIYYDNCVQHNDMCLYYYADSDTASPLPAVSVSSTSTTLPIHVTVPVGKCSCMHIHVHDTL